VDFAVTGPVIWRGGFNSERNSIRTNNLYLDTECGINRVAIRSTLAPGTITVHRHARADSHPRYTTRCRGAALRFQIPAWFPVQFSTTAPWVPIPSGSAWPCLVLSHSSSPALV
jgi:hypothetical protein